MHFLRTKRRASVSPFLIGFPLLAMVISVVLAFGSITGGNANYSICNPNATSCTTNGTLNSSSGSTEFHCSNNTGNPLVNLIPVPCSLPGPCPHVLPASTSCSIAGVWLLNAGADIIIPNSLLFSGSQTTGGQTIAGGQGGNNGFFFGLGTITGGQGFIVLIGIIVGVVVLAGINAFGSGEQSESIHILFMGGMMTGLWVLLSTLDGFANQSKASMFVQLNGFAFDGLGLGTVLYGLLTMMYFIGFMSMVKRGI